MGIKNFLSRSPIRPLRFWSHKILPLVYEDSLSYYELLCKVVAYINQLIEANESIGEDLKNLFDSYEWLSDLVTPELKEVVDTLMDRSTANEVLVSEVNQCPNIMYKCAMSYLKNNDKLTYYLSGNAGYPACFATELNEETDEMENFTIKGTYRSTQPVFSFTCSALVLACMLNVPYEMSRYANGTVTDIDGTPFLSGGKNYSLTGNKLIDLFDKKVLQYIKEGNKWFYAGGLAHLLYDAGMLHKLDEDNFDKLQPGDIVFGKGSESGYWKNIGHTEIFMGWNHQRAYVVSAQTENARVVQIVLRTREYMEEHWWYYARIPVAGSFPAGNTVVYSDFNPLEASSEEIAYVDEHWYKSGVGRDKYKWHNVEEFTCNIASGSTAGLYVSTNKFVFTKTALKHGLYTLVIKVEDVPSSKNIRFNIAGRREIANTDNYGSAQIWLNADPEQYVGDNTYFVTFAVPDTAYNVNDWCFWLSDTVNGQTIRVVSMRVYDGVVHPSFSD